MSRLGTYLVRYPAPLAWDECMLGDCWEDGFYPCASEFFSRQPPAPDGQLSSWRKGCCLAVEFIGFCEKPLKQPCRARWRYLILALRQACSFAEPANAGSTRETGCLAKTVRRRIKRPGQGKER